MLSYKELTSLMELNRNSFSFEGKLCEMRVKGIWLKTNYSEHIRTIENWNIIATAIFTVVHGLYQTQTLWDILGENMIILWMLIWIELKYFNSNSAEVKDILHGSSCQNYPYQLKNGMYPTSFYKIKWTECEIAGHWGKLNWPKYINNSGRRIIKSRIDVTLIIHRFPFQLNCG